MDNDPTANRGHGGVEANDITVPRSSHDGLLQAELDEGAVAGLEPISVEQNEACHGLGGTDVEAHALPVLERPR